MTVENCNKSDQVRKHRSLRLALGTIFLGTALFASLGINQSHAGIIESSTEITQARKKSCSGIEPSYNIKRAGQTAFKHWINRCGKRAELEKNKTKIGGTYWYGWSTFIPADWQDTDAGFDIVNQFGAYPSKPGRKYKCGGIGSKISRRGGSLIFDLQRKGNSVDVECTNYTLAKVSEIKGKWTDFVMHVKWTGNKDGFLKVWVKVGDGPYVQKIDYQGATFWNDEGTGPYFKMGLYKGSTNFKGPAPRVVYTDEYRLGDANSSFGQVAP